MKKYNLTGMSANALESLARHAANLARDLRDSQPSYALALEAGVEDRSYSTVRYGRIASYRGEAVVKMDDGKKWRAVGHGPTGTAEYVSRKGYIEFIPIE